MLRPTALYLEVVITLMTSYKEVNGHDVTRKITLFHFNFGYADEIILNCHTSHISCHIAYRCEWEVALLLCLMYGNFINTLMLCMIFYLYL